MKLKSFITLVGIHAQWLLEITKLCIRRNTPWANSYDKQLWKELLVGGLSVPELLAKCKEKKIRFSKTVEIEIKKKTRRISETTLKKKGFAMKSLQEFGFNGKTFGELQDFFSKHSLFEQCTVEDLYYLRVAYREQYRGFENRVYVDAGVISDPEFNKSTIFILDHSDTEELSVFSFSYSPWEKVYPEELWAVAIRTEIDPIPTEDFLKVYEDDRALTPWH